MQLLYGNIFNINRSIFRSVFSRTFPFVSVVFLTYSKWIFQRESTLSHLKTILLFYFYLSVLWFAFARPLLTRPIPHSHKLCVFFLSNSHPSVCFSLSLSRMLLLHICRPAFDSFLLSVSTVRNK